MAKGQSLSRHQQKIVNRYYDHRDTIMLQKLREIVSELYLAAGDDKELKESKKSKRLWDSAEKALSNLKAEGPDVERLLAARDVEKLAAYVGGLS